MPAWSASSVRSPLESSLGLFPGQDFRLTTGRCSDCAAIPQALWYFADETIAAPRAGVAVAGFARGVRAWQDLQQWAATQGAATALDAPPLVWIGAPEIVRHATLAADGAMLAAGVERWPFAPVPKIAHNRSYYNGASTAYLAARTLSVRGTRRDGTFIARTIWPEDFRLDSSAALQPVDASAKAVQELVRAEPQGGARSPFAAFPIWERTPPSSPRCSTARRVTTTRPWPATSPWSPAGSAQRSTRQGRRRWATGW